MKAIKLYIWKTIYYILGHLWPKGCVTVHFRRSTGRSLNWQHPRDINEKIQWLKFYGDTSKWTRLADKYAVREYIKEKGFEDMLIPLLGRWEHTEDIDWDALPPQFVMKTNHGSGDALICTDKSQLDIRHWTQYFSRLLKEKFGTQMGQPHYDKIKPCVIAEQLMDCTKQQIKSTSLVDYKIWTFDGKPAYIWACYNRTKESCEVAVYDLDWNFHPEYSHSESHYVLADRLIPCPASLDKMLHAASVLSKGFPVVRMDFYEVDGKPYFGEMTFTPAAGFNDFYTQDFLNILGDLCKIK